MVLHIIIKNFSEPASENGEIGSLNLESHFEPNLKIGCSILLNSYPKL